MAGKQSEAEAKKAAHKLADEMREATGLNWEPHHWRNLGWHSKVTLESWADGGGYSISKNYSKGYSCYACCSGFPAGHSAIFGDVPSAETALEAFDMAIEQVRARTEKTLALLEAGNYSKTLQTQVDKK